MGRKRRTTARWWPLSHARRPSRRTLPPLRHFGLGADSPVAIFADGRAVNRQAGADMHLPLEVSMAVSGSIRTWTSRDCFHAGAGQVRVLASLEPHYWESQPGYSGVVFLVLPSLLSQMPVLKGFDPTRLFRLPRRWAVFGSSPETRRSLAALGRELRRKYRRSFLPGPALLDLLRVAELACGEPQPRAHHRRVRGHPPDAFATGRITAAIELLVRSPDRPVRVHEAAHACGMATRTFARHFRQVMGQGFAEFGVRWRLTEAGRLLKTTDLPIKGIAQHLGFADVSHFHRAFRRHYGTTPLAFRTVDDW